MKRVMISIVAVMLVAFSAAGLVQAGDTDRGCAAKECAYTGWITSINETRDRIIVSGDEGDKSFVLSNPAPKALRVNERVTVNYTGKDGRLIASSVGAPEYLYTGRITSINKAGDRIIVSGDEGDKSFVLLVDPPLQLNEKVDVYYTEKDGRLIATSVKAARPYQVPKELEQHFRDEMQQS
ncbi:MAG TPA: hypothetical protein VL354_01235 [Spirochaetia bacterium]|nr:hypothetical protein [Spirochaetia bacterium]